MATNGECNSRLVFNYGRLQYYDHSCANVFLFEYFEKTMGLKRFLSGANAMVGIATGDDRKVVFHQCLKEAENGNVVAQYTIGCV